MKKNPDLFDAIKKKDWLLVNEIVREIVAAEKVRTQLPANGLIPLDVRARLMRRGETVGSWARTHGYLRPTVWYAIHRNHQGRLSILIRKTLRQELGITQGEKE